MPIEQSVQVSEQLHNGTPTHQVCTSAVTANQKNHAGEKRDLIAGRSDVAETQQTDGSRDGCFDRTSLLARSSCRAPVACFARCDSATPFRTDQLIWTSSSRRFQWYHVAMKETFDSWRRKVGVATLAMACALTAMWLRSMVVSDLIQIPLGHTELRLVSSNQLFSWSLRKDGKQFLWTRFDHRNSLRPEHGYGGAGEGAHYVALIVPPIVVSVWLLLWKPRRQSPTRLFIGIKTKSPDADEGNQALNSHEWRVGRVRTPGPRLDP